MDLELEEIGLMLVNNYALLLQNYTSINALMAAGNIIDACVEHIKNRVDIFSIRCFQIICLDIKGTAEVFECLLCRESRGAFVMCLIQQSLIFHSKKRYTKGSRAH